MNIMRDNCHLIKEISILRVKVKSAESTLKNHNSKAGA